MPANIIKGLAKESGKSEKEVEKAWDESKAIVEDDYNVKEKDFKDKQWAIVTTITKKKIGIKENAEWIKSFLESGKPAKEYFGESNNIDQVKNKLLPYRKKMDVIYNADNAKKEYTFVLKFLDGSILVYNMDKDYFRFPKSGIANDFYEDLIKFKLNPTDLSIFFENLSGMLYDVGISSDLKKYLNETQISSMTPALNSEIIKPVIDKDEEEEIEKDEEDNSGIENGFDVPMFSTDMVESENKKKNLNNDIEKIDEAGFGSNVDRGIELVASQLGKKTGQKFDVSPMVETYSNSYGNYEAYNIVSKNRRVRFNIRIGDSTSQIESVDIWYSNFLNDTPNRTVSLEGLNILQVLDEIASLISNPLEESLMVEARTRQTKDRSPSNTITQLSKEARALGLTELESPTKLIYTQLEDFVNMLGTGMFNGLIVTGAPGLGKTQTFKNVLNKTKSGSNYALLKANLGGPSSLYKLLYKNPDKMIVFDEADSMLLPKNPYRNLMLTMLEPSGRRVLSYLNKRDPDIKSGEYKQTVEIKNHFGFISNLPESKIDPAIASRCLMINIDLTKKQILEAIKDKLKNFNRSVSLETKILVYEFLEKNIKSISKLDFRRYSQVLNIACMYPTKWTLYAKQFLR